jgi:alpha-galactosidase
MGKRIVLIGAGSAQFGYGTIGDILQSKVLEGSHIVLHDINPSTLAVVEQNGRAFIEEHGLPFGISATTNRAEALSGADFLIISIEVGNRFELWEQDWRIPQQYGIRQVYGENGGPGGSSIHYALSRLSWRSAPTRLRSARRPQSLTSATR